MSTTTKEILTNILREKAGLTPEQFYLTKPNGEGYHELVAVKDGAIVSLGEIHSAWLPPKGRSDELAQQLTAEFTKMAASKYHKPGIAVPTLIANVDAIRQGYTAKQSAELNPTGASVIYAQVVARNTAATQGIQVG